jgi:site-specific DNA-cytosine methylase
MYFVNSFCLVANYFSFLSKGTIVSVHYRVLYDDGDTETFNSKELYENLACNDQYMSSKYTNCSMMELFSGCSLLSTLCRRKGMNAISFDNDPESNATIKADFRSPYVQTLLTNCIQDYIHASPPCFTYSHLAGGRHRDQDNFNKSVASHDADNGLLQLYLNFDYQLRQNPDCIFTIENPFGKSSHSLWSILQILFTLCSYSLSPHRLDAQKQNNDNAF